MAQEPESTSESQRDQVADTEATYCSNCGNALNPDEKFCSECGTTQEEVTDSATAESDGFLDRENEPKAAMAGAGLAILGSFLPWASALGQTVLGIEGDGIITLVFAIGVLGLVYTQDWDKRTIYGTLAGGAIITLIPLISLSGLSAFGVYVTIVGGVAMIVAGFSGYQRL